MENPDRKFIQLAIEKAKESVASGEFPAGAVIVKAGEIIGEGVSIGNRLNDPTSHGEIDSIRNACKNIQSSDLSKCTLYTSMQPCLMCFAASMWSLIGKIVFACSKEKVSSEYYGGSYHISKINSDLIHPIELVHFSELEQESLKVVQEWERVIFV
jgi:tRNA(Arg) A34 adenosine deaminase TadA